MKITSLALAAALLAPSWTSFAQVAVAPPAAPEKPAVTCPCDQSSFKPLNDKARAVAAYWDARRKYKLSSSIAGTVAIFAILARSGGAMNEAQNALSNARAELDAARSLAVKLDGIKVTDFDDKTVELKLKKGVDYTL